MSYFKNPLWDVIGMLAITGIVLALYSFSSTNIHTGELKPVVFINEYLSKIDSNLNIDGFEIEKTGIKEFIVSEQKTEALSIKLASSIKNIEKAELDTSKQRILFIGDSMLEGLMYRAKEYTNFNNHELFPIIWYSSSTMWYGQYDTISYFIKKHKPSYIFLVLGANELFIRDIFKKRNKYVKRILEQIDTIPFIWIGPPNWKDDTGINDMIQANVDESQYFESKKLKYKRTKDGAHPVRSSSNMWMDSIASWVMSSSKHPIILKKPIEKVKARPHPTLLQPMK